jgi:hypothetical protein
MSNRMQLVDLSAQAAYPTTPQVDLPFDAKLSVVNESTPATPSVFYVSFNGVDDHARLTLATPSAAFGFQATRRKMWLRCPAPAAGTVVAQVVAEGV